MSVIEVRGRRDGCHRDGRSDVAVIGVTVVYSGGDSREQSRSSRDVLNGGL